MHNCYLKLKSTDFHGQFHFTTFVRWYAFDIIIDFVQNRIELIPLDLDPPQSDICVIFNEEDYFLKKDAIARKLGEFGWEYFEWDHPASIERAADHIAKEVEKRAQKVADVFFKRKIPRKCWDQKQFDVITKHGKKVLHCDHCGQTLRTPDEVGNLHREARWKFNLCHRCFAYFGSNKAFESTWTARKAK